MCNKNRAARAFSPRLSKQSTPVKPYVPVADPDDGLIKIEDLLVDVDVYFPFSGDDQVPGDRYQLVLNGKLVGAFEVLPDPLPAIGTELKLIIPVDTELKADGIYDLQYELQSFPGGTPNRSYATTILVDLTAPGAHQLGYMDFPDEARDGLTAVELAAMGDVLTGRIFGYTGLTKDDVIQTYWGNVQGPKVELDGSEDGSTPIEIAFDKAFLLGIGNVAVPTYYTVKDRAGNTSEPSRQITIPLFLTEVTPDLPPPIIESYDGLIDYSDAISRVEVQIPGSSVIEAGDQITLQWGLVDLGPFPVDPDDIGEPVVLVFDVDYASIELAGNGDIALKYNVVRTGNVVGISQTLNITVDVELPVPGVIDRPTIRGGSSTPSSEDNLIDENDFDLDATVIINWNTSFDASEKITVYWGGVEVLEEPYIITNTDVAGARPLLLKALNTKFKPVGTGPDIRVYYTVSSDASPNISKSLEQGVIVRSKDELPGGPDGADAPEFTSLNENGLINPSVAINGAPVYIKPYINIAAGQVITYTYEAYDQLVGGNLKFIWTHISPSLTDEQVINGYEFTVDRLTLVRHCRGRIESYFQVQSDKGQGSSKRTSVLIDMRNGHICE